MPRPVTHLNFRSIRTLLYIGLLGAAVYAMLLPAVDFQAGAPVAMRQEKAVQRAYDLMEALQVDTRDLAAFPARYQRQAFFDHLRDSLGGTRSITPSKLNRSGLPLNGWRVRLGQPHDTFWPVAGETAFFTDVDHMRVDFDDRLRVRMMDWTAGFADDRFLPASDQAEVGEHLLGDLLGYDANAYGLGSADGDIGEVTVGTLATDTSGTTLTWTRRDATYAGPDRIIVDLKPTVREITTDTSTRFQPGFILGSVQTKYHESEQETYTNTGYASEAVVFFATILLLVVLVLVTALQRIFRGEVIWWRAGVVTLLLVLFLAVWRYLVFSNSYYQFYLPEFIGIDLASQTLGYFFIALYGGLAYMGWESLARKAKDPHIAMADAIWRGRLLNRDLGQSILAGYGFAGMLLAVFATMLVALDLVFFQFDSQFGFVDVASVWPAMSTLLSGIANTWLIGFGFFGVAMTQLQRFIRKGWVVVPVAAFVLGLLTTLGGRHFATTGTVFEDMVLMIAVALPLVIAYRHFGLFATMMAWFVFFVVVRLGVYVGSPDPHLTGQAVQLGLILLVPMVGGWVMYRFGASTASDDTFVPDYEERNLKQLRIEKEFQIAKDSQFALMPRSAPAVPGAEVKGFFIPSFEVGGDFYDYQMVENDLLVTVVDVSGKAMKAAFGAIFTSGLLLSRLDERDPARVLTAVNPLLVSRTDKLTFITCLLARYDVQTRILKFANAGHCKPLLKRAGTANWLDAPAPRYPLGMRPDVTFANVEYALQPGDLVLFYSDGFPEARNKKGDLYGFDGIRTRLTTLDTDTMTAEQICEAIRLEILAYSEYELADDMTVVALRVV